MGIRDDPTIVVNLVDAFLDDRNSDSAQEVLDSYLKKFPKDFSLRSKQAALSAQQEDPEQAMSIYAELFAEGYDNEDELLAYLNLAAAAEEYQQAISTLEHVIAKNPSDVVERWYAVMLCKNGQFDEAIECMLKLTEQDKDDLDSAYTLGEVYEMAGRFNESIAICDNLFEKVPGDVGLHLMKGRCEFELKWYSKARTSFEAVLEQQPENAEAKEYLKYSAALLGQGDRTQLGKPIEPVALPDALRKLIAAAQKQPPGPLENDYDLTEIYNITGVSYQSDAPRRITTRRKLRVNTTAGIDSLSTLTVSFDPLFERIYVNRLAVFDASGELISEGKLEDYYVLDDTDSVQASQDRRVYIPVSGLKDRCQIELVVTVERLSEDREVGYEQQFLVATHPLRLGAVYFSGDLSAIEHVASGVEAEKVGPDLQIWSVVNPLVYEFEEDQAPIEGFVPVVQICDRGMTWEQVGREYLGRIDDKLKLDDKTRSKAESITEGIDSERGKIVALAKFVQSSCTYRAIEFGVRSQVPNTAEQVLKNSYGDCKDHSVLLAQLLKSVGIEAYPALVNSGGQVTEQLPSLDQFNHMIVYVKLSDGGRELFLDTTEKYTSPSVPQTGLADQYALVLNPAAPTLARTPGYGQKAGKVRVERVVTISPKSDFQPVELAITERLLLNAYCARGLRGYFQSYRARDRKTAARDLLSAVAKVRVRKLTIENLDEPTKDLVLNMEYELPKSMNQFGEDTGSYRLVGAVPALWEQYFLEREPDDSRVSPFELKMPFAISSKTTYEMSPEYELLNSSRLTGGGKSKFLSWDTRVKDNGDQFVIQSMARRGVGLFPPKEFEEYRRITERVVSTMRTPVRIGRKAQVPD